MSSNRAPKQSLRRIYWVLLAIILFIAGTTLPVYNSVNIRTPATIESGRIGRLWLALREYADDNDGKFPSALADMTPRLLQTEALQFHDPATKKPVNWLYYPGHTIHDPPGTILAACPVPLVEREQLIFRVNHRIVTTVGTSNEYLTEEEFQRRMAVPSTSPVRDSTSLTQP